MKSLPHSLPDHLELLDDPRRPQGRRHSQVSVLALATAAVMAGHDSYKAITQWVRAQSPTVLRRFRVRLCGGRHVVPSESTIRLVLTRTNPMQLLQALKHFLHPHPVPKDKVIAIDGKTLCGTGNDYDTQIQVFSAVGHDSRNTYALEVVETGADGDKRSNEIPSAVPTLEQIEDLRGIVVTADALHTQTDLAQYLHRRGAHHLFAVKKNKEHLLEGVDTWFKLNVVNCNRPPDYVFKDAKAPHGRIEVREIWVTSELNDYLGFPHTQQAFVVRRFTHNLKTGEKRIIEAYGITSLSAAEADPKRLLKLNRGHWTIEATHHVLDVSFNEDDSRIRTGYGPINMTLLRRLAISIFKQRGLPYRETMRRLTFNVRAILSFLKMTANSMPKSVPNSAFT